MIFLGKLNHLDLWGADIGNAFRTKDYAIRFRTDQPDYSFLPDQDFDWTYSVYGNVQEILPDDMPEPLGAAVITTTTNRKCCTAHFQGSLLGCY